MLYFFLMLAEALKYQNGHDSNKHQAEQQHSQ